MPVAPSFVVRHGRAVLLGMLALCALWAAAVIVYDDSGAAVEMLLEAGPPLVLIVVYATSGRRVRFLARFMVHAGSFRMPQSAWNAMESFAGLLVGTSAMAQGWDRLVGAEVRTAAKIVPWIAVVGWTVIVPLVIAEVCLGRGLELRPEGLVERRLLSVLRVPWEALRPGHPVRPELDATVLPLSVDRPELVRRHGLRRGPADSVEVRHIHPWFLADAIQFYVHSPHERASIGTADGHRRLLQALTDARWGDSAAD